MKYIEAGYDGDPNKFQLDFVNTFGKDIAECIGEMNLKELTSSFYQLICITIDVMSLARKKLEDNGITVNLMRVELIKLEFKRIKLQIVPLNNKGQPIATDLEMPTVILNPDEKEKRKKLTSGSIIYPLLPELPKNN